MKSDSTKSNYLLDIRILISQVCLRAALKVAPVETKRGLIIVEGVAEISKKIVED